MQNEAISKRRNFDEAFKRDAVTLLCKGDKRLKQLAEELGVSHWNLRDWKKRYGPPAPIRSSEVLEAEVRALRRENERLRAQRDILKKTLGILVEPGPNASPAGKHWPTHTGSRTCAPPLRSRVVATTRGESVCLAPASAPTWS